MKKLFFVLSAVLFTAACSSAPAGLEGVWVQPIAAQPDRVQGIRLNPDGSAQSIHMATLVYETWRTDGNTLILSGQSLGNGQTILFTENYTFSFPQPDTLVLTDTRGGEKVFTRQK